MRMFPQDKSQVLATDEQLTNFGEAMDQVAQVKEPDEASEMTLCQVRVDEESPFLNRTMKEAGVRDKYHCLIAGVERGSDKLHAPDPREPFHLNDVVWVVGEKKNVYRLSGKQD